MLFPASPYFRLNNTTKYTVDIAAARCFIANDKI
jgi:hypothetical protein